MAKLEMSDQEKVSEPFIEGSGTLLRVLTPFPDSGILDEDDDKKYLMYGIGKDWLAPLQFGRNDLAVLIPAKKTSFP